MKESAEIAVARAQSDPKIQEGGTFALWLGDADRAYTAYPQAGYMGGVVHPAPGDRVAAKYTYDGSTWSLTWSEEVITAEMVSAAPETPERDRQARLIGIHYDHLGRDTEAGTAYLRNVVQPWTTLNGPLYAVYNED